jgi:hypothetical protein
MPIPMMMTFEKIVPIEMTKMESMKSVAERMKTMGWFLIFF